MKDSELARLIGRINNLRSHRYRVAWLWLLVTALPGCGVNSPLPPDEIPFAELEPIPAGKATIYVYRANTVAAELAWPVVYLDEEPVNILQHRGFLFFHVEPGEHKVLVKKGEFGDDFLAREGWNIREKELTVNAETGRYYFMRLKPGLQKSPLGWRDATFKLVDKPRAEKELENCYWQRP